MKSKNENLRKAKKEKNDEFYTQYDDIQAELNNYIPHFKDKTVLCNCDDPFESNFCKYFMTHFYHLGLKRLICTSYAHSPLSKDPEHGFVIDVSDVPHANNNPTEAEVEEFLKTGIVRKLEGDGSFESDECIEFLKEADIVCTNPPFSRFRDYLGLLVEYEKKFLIIGNQNAITYKEVFPLIKDNKMWLGNGFKGNVGFFKSNYKDYATASEHRDGLIRISGVMWFTNLDLPKRHEPLDLMTISDNIRFSPDKKVKGKGYQKYDNYDAIEVPSTKAIPRDYPGVMGVPITFLDKYCPEQFEIVGDSRYHDGQEMADDINVVNGKLLYRRILIRYTDAWKASHRKDFEKENI